MADNTATGTMEEGRLIIIDGNSLLNRAYHAISRPMVTSEGIYTQGIFGFLNMLAKVKSDYSPSHITVTFDRKAPTFRHKEYDKYKAGRPKMPMELAMQIPLLKEILEAMGIVILEMDGYEADDIIGTVAVRGEEEGLAPLIITGDRDALQLASDKTRVLITKKGISEFALYDAKAIEEEYGFSPTRFIDYKALMGDASDNIPGLPGVGKKTAEKLIREYGSVENLLENAESIDNERLRGIVTENAGTALMSKKLATIITQVPVEIDFGRMKVREPDIEKLVPIYVKLEFNSFLKKLGQGGRSADGGGYQGLAAGTGGGELLGEVETVLVKDMQGLDKAADEFAGEPYLILKTFGNGDHKERPLIYGVNIMSAQKRWYIETENRPELVIGLISHLMRVNVPLSGHYIQSDIFALIRSSGEAAVSGFYPEIAFDTAVAQYVISPTSPYFSLRDLALKWLSVDLPELDDVSNARDQIDMFTDMSAGDAARGGQICRVIASLIPLQRERIRALGLDAVISQVDFPLILPLAMMEAEGFSFDKAALKKVGAEIAEGLDGLAEGIYAMAGEEFNINSPQQLGIVLFEKMGLPKGKKTQRGYATGAEVLEKLRDKSPIIDKILEYRTLSKLQSTYINGLMHLSGSDGKIHAHFQQTVTATGRISCTEPNLQNIPVRQELGKKIRKAFVPEDDGYILVGADYSQIELRVLAHLSGDPMLLEDFRQNADIHRRTAARVFGVDEPDVTSQMRSSAKAVNFGIIYGISSFGLAEGLGISRYEAENYIKDYFQKHKAVKEYLDGCVAAAKGDGFVATIMGRRRDIPEIQDSNYAVRNFGERLAMNSPIQGSAADIMKLAMIGVDRALRARGLGARIILQVHDELIIQSQKSEADAVAAILKEEMEGAYELDVPLVAEVNRGKNWFDLK